MKRTCVLLLLAFLFPFHTSSGTEPDPLLWPEEHRAFLHDGPGLLLSPEERQEFLALDEDGRREFVRAFLERDPLPETPENELQEGIRRRRELVYSEFLTLLDDRPRLLFLHGSPADRQVLDCGFAFKPLEVWTYETERGPRELVLYQPAQGAAYRLWHPLDSKRVLYTSEMEYWLEQWEELQGRIIARRFDLQICPEAAKRVDAATGVEGLRGFRRDRPTHREIASFLSPPGDLASWARKAAATPLPEPAPPLQLGEVEIQFPAEHSQRVVSRILLPIPPQEGVQVAEEGEKPELRFKVQGVVEHEERVFDQFTLRYRVSPPPPGTPLALAVDLPLRPDRSFLVRLQVTEEVGGGRVLLARGFQVPREAQPLPEPPVPEEVIIALGEELAKEILPGRDSLILVPPETDVVFGLWRAEALVTGGRIQKVVFLVDEQAQLIRTRPPYTAELRLSQYPVEQVVRAEGYDANGELVAADEVVLNQPRGELKVRILEPRRGAAVAGKVQVRAEVVVPEEKRVERVEFRLNEALEETLTRPPWVAEMELANLEEMAYLSVVAYLEDGSRAEDVRFLNAPRFLEQVDVNLVELYTTVTDRSGRLARGLAAEDFEVLEDGRPQQITKFELVEDLPLTLGIVIDTSSSMVDSLVEAQKAAIAFLDNIVTSRDRCFAVAFSDHPSLLMPPTDDVGAVADTLRGLQALGWTSLHDAIVTSLYYFRGIRGRRALVLLSDGDDTSSQISFRDAMEYARRSGVAIYPIGLKVSSFSFQIRSKLTRLAEETGGKVFFVDAADELFGVYQQIEEELRSQYLIAYVSSARAQDGSFRTVEVKVRKSGLKARTIRGYYP